MVRFHPGPHLVSKSYFYSHTFGFKEILAKFTSLFWVKQLTGENIQISTVSMIGKMARDQGSFYQLGHGKTINFRILSKMDNLSLAKLF